MGLRFTSVFSDKNVDWHFVPSPRSFVLYDSCNNAIVEIDKKSGECYCIPGYEIFKEGNIRVLKDDNPNGNVLGFIWLNGSKTM